MNKSLKNKLKKGFTLIELLIVIAIIGILVLLAVPSFLGQADKAKMTSLKNDVKIAENKASSFLFEHGTLRMNEEGDLGFAKYTPSGKEFFYGLKGEVDVDIDAEGEFYDVSSKVDSKFSNKGRFIANDKGKAFYTTDKKISSKENSKDEPKVAPESDFEWIEAGYGYNFEGKKEEGFWKYIGDENTVVIPETIEGQTLTSYAFMFQETEVSKVISNNTHVVNMDAMFNDSKAPFLDVTELNTSNVTSMNGMFSTLEASVIKLGNFDTSKVTDMGYMFSGIRNMNSLDLSMIDTSSATIMTGMFSNTKIKDLNLSGFDTSKVTQMNYMFRSFEGNSLDLSMFNTSNVTDMSYMFDYLKAPVLDITSFNTSKVTSTNDMFYNALTTKVYVKDSSVKSKLDKSSRKPSTLIIEVK